MLTFNIKQNVQDHRLSGADSHHAVSSGSAVQSAQPCDSNAAHAAHLSPAGAHQDAGAVATGCKWEPEIEEFSYSVLRSYYFVLTDST